MIVFWTEEAYDELDALLDYIASYNPGMAEKVVDRIAELIAVIEQFPKMGRELDESGLRRLVITGTPCIIYYRLLPEYIAIEGVAHTSQRRPRE